MDPAHIPFAHHALQSVREDGTPIPMRRLSEPDDATRLEVGFEDVVRGTKRDGVVSFIPPVYYHFRTAERKVADVDATEGKGVAAPPPPEQAVRLLALAVPVTTGRSRVLLYLPALSKLPLPIWLSHAFSNRFLEVPRSVGV